jgi:hypothetical protein
VLACLLALAILLPSTTVAAAPERRQVTSSPGRSLNPHQLPTQPPTGDTPEQVTEVPRNLPVDQATYARLKAQADAAAAARDKGAAPRTLETGPAAQFTTLTSTKTGGWNPPDGGLAVGPTSVLSMANEALAVYDRSGAVKLGPLGLAGFFNDSGASSVYDPRALYDAGNAATARTSRLRYRKTKHPRALPRRGAVISSMA